ncbi:MAG: hypothetical protein L0922_04385, partial [Candidatus Mariimomonas ferrooxydans]
FFMDSTNFCCCPSSTFLASISSLLTKGAAQVSAAASREEIEAIKEELGQQQKFVESMKKIEPLGRLSVQLVHLRLLKGSEYDIELTKGDYLFIPVKNSTVNVMGAVMSMGSLYILKIWIIRTTLN